MVKRIVRQWCVVLVLVDVTTGIQNLMDLDIIWCAIDGEKKVLRSLKRGVQHKHFLFVGLGVMLEESQEG